MRNAVLLTGLLLVLPACGCRHDVRPPLIGVARPPAERWPHRGHRLPTPPETRAQRLSGCRRQPSHLLPDLRGRAPTGN